MVPRFFAVLFEQRKFKNHTTHATCAVMALVL